MLAHRLFTLALLAGLTAPVGAAKFYKSIDENGTVSYSQTRPSGGNSQAISLRGVPQVSNQQAREQLNQLSERTQTARADREFKNNYATESKSRDERMKANCETARENARVLETASRVKSADGSFIDDATRAKNLAQAKKQIDDFCQ